MVFAHKLPSTKQLKNEKALIIYATFLIVLILLIVAARWLYTFSRNDLRITTPNRASHACLRCYNKFFRTIDKRTSWKWLSRPSLGLVLLTSIYLLANAILASTVFAAYRVNHFASRFGWLAAANMALCTFFAMKNTPLAPITALPHNQLNILHRLAGYTAAFLVSLHAILYAVHFGRQGRWGTLLESGNVEGLGSGAATVFLLLGIFRYRDYQLFLSSHILAFISLIILTALHRPDWANKLPLVMVVMACIWVVDRIIRAAKLVCNAVNNSATLYPLADGATRVLLAKPCASDVLPGFHCFLWIPRLSVYQMHPFTIANNGTNGLELVIKAQGPYTRALHTLAQEHAGRPILASMDGLYGFLPDATAYNKVVLIAGGSGAAFALGLLNHTMNQGAGKLLIPIDFVWAVKYTEHLDWFADHLCNLTRWAPTLNISIYVTGEGKQATSEASTCLGPCSSLAYTRVESGMLEESGGPEHEHDDETAKLLSSYPVYDGNGEYSPTTKYGKIVPERVIEGAIEGMQSCDRVLIAACGPVGLVDSVKDVADDLQKRVGCEIDVHCEGFGG